MKHELPRILIGFLQKLVQNLKIDTSAIKFDDYLEHCNTILPDNLVSLNEPKDAFFSLNKSLIIIV